MAQEPRPEGERIAKLLARAGVASRREVERMIADGRVAIDGKVLETPATIIPHLRGVTVDGKPVAKADRTRLFAFHKPTGLITAERDPKGRPTIYTALRNALPKDAGRVMPVGRLDLNTEGLLLLTNDGEFKRAMELPASGIPRTYRARTFGEVRQEQLEELMDGVTIDGMRYGPIDANMERRTGRNQWIELTITEGKNREIRRVLEHLELQVSRLIRIGYGPFALDDLPRGAGHCQFVEHDEAAVKAIRANIAAFDARARSDVRAGSVLTLGPKPEAKDLILLDPPYATGAGSVALDRLLRLGWIGEATWIALETGADETVAVKGLSVEAERRVGKAKLTLLRLAARD